MRDFFIYLVIILGVISPSAVHAEQDGAIWLLQIENDALAPRTNTDRHYTHGMRFLRLSPPTDLPRWLDALTVYPSFFGPSGREPIQRWAVSVGHSMFTPDMIGDPNLIPDDRPYAGWSYLGFSFYNEFLGTDGAARQDVSAIELGIVGPSSGAEEIQKFYHKLKGGTIPQGWDHQLKDEPGLQLIFERKWRSPPVRPIPDDAPEFDIVPHVAMTLGNVTTDFGIGATFRVGRNLQADFGPPRIRPGLPGSDGFDRKNRVDWYLFLGPELRYVARNIFVDGNTWKESHSVDRRPFVLDSQAGFVVLFGDTRISYTHVLLSPEFNEQRDWDQFGALTISWKF